MFNTYVLPKNGQHRIATTIGQLSYKTDYPTPATIEKLIDELVYQAAVPTYLWSYPLSTVISMSKGHYEAGATNTSIPIFENFLKKEEMSHGPI